MLRRLIMATLVVVALASVCQQAQASCHCRRGGVVDYLFGGYGPGLFGYGGGYSYAGFTPPANYTECGRRIGY
jgi:hypothetical protein